MQFIEKYVTKKNLAIINLIAGGVAAVFFVFVLTLNVSTIEGAIGSLQFVVMLYYVYLIAIIIETIAASLLCFVKKQKDTSTYLYLGVSIAGLLVVLFNFSLFKVLSQLLSGNFMAMYGMGDGASYSTTLRLLQIMMFVHTVFAVYTGVKFFKKKDVESIELTEEEKEQLKVQMQKAKEVSNKGLQKVKAFLSTKQGKGCLGAIIIVLVVIVGFNVYTNNFQKTSIDLFQGCKVSVSGIDGKGEARITDCHIDYDKTKEDLAMFVKDVTYEIKNNGSLKNKDNVVITAMYSQATADTLRLSIKQETMEQKVEGLIVNYAKASDVPTEMMKIIDEAILKEVDKSANSIDFQLDKDIKMTGKEVLGKVYGRRTWSSEEDGNSMVYLVKVNAEGQKRTSYFEEKYKKAKDTAYYTVRVNKINSVFNIEENPASLSNVYVFGETDDKEQIERFLRDQSDEGMEEVK